MSEGENVGTRVEVSNYLKSRYYAVSQVRPLSIFRSMTFVCSGLEKDLGRTPVAVPRGFT